MSDGDVTYMNSGGAVHTSSLGDIIRVNRTPPVPICRVCGKERHMKPFGSYLDKRNRPHDDCDRQVAEWRKRVAEVNQDPDYLAAVDVVETWRTAADQVWEVKLRALGLPDWLIEQEIAEHADVWRE